ncbi:hypothetical protein MWU65_17585, partial [Cellulophaga sp. F20128]|uniref:hypothetical protein n=1 Tax=Cellulophaga sp. F20128 TaxID=2926413 RepID=UPI001FF62357
MAGKLESLRLNKPYDNRTFEDTWVKSKGVSAIAPFANPLKSARTLVKEAMAKPIPVIVNSDDILVGNWTSKDNSFEWPIKREYLQRIKEIKFMYTEGESRVRIIGVELIADGKPIYSNSEVRFIE